MAGVSFVSVSRLAQETRGIDDSLNHCFGGFFIGALAGATHSKSRGSKMILFGTTVGALAGLSDAMLRYSLARPADPKQLHNSVDTMRLVHKNDGH